MNTRILLLILIVFVCPFQKSNADQLLQKSQNDTIQAESNKSSLDPIGRSNPRGTVDGFLRALANENFLRAAEYIDFSQTNIGVIDSSSIGTIEDIEIVFNKYGSILPVSIINNSTDGDINDGLDVNIENVGTLDIDKKKIAINLERIKVKSEAPIWLISGETTKALLNYIDSTEFSSLESPIPDELLQGKWKGAPLFDWIAIIVLAFASYMAAWLITTLIKLIVRSLWRGYSQSRYSKFLRTLLIPLRLIIAVAIVLNISRIVGLSIVVRQAFSYVNLIALWTALFIFIWLLIDTISSIGEDRLREREIFGGLSAVSFLKNSAKFALVVIAILIVFETLGFNVTAGIAALGVGGIALALGAQKTVENIVGGLSVVFDQPVSVGDFCKFGDTVGTVEKIGMRSTRIRTLGRTLVTIPNADFSSQLIENYAERDMFLFLTTLGLRYETSSDQMRYILVELRKILYAHPKVDPEPARVRFLGYGSDSLKVEIFAYIRVADWNEYLGVQEDINLRIAKVIEDSGSGFAFPSQTVYISQDQGLSETKKAEAEAKVKEWIDNNALQIPSFDSQTIESLKNTLKYPPNEGNT
ncbi:mechanosensitive ion channel [Winogradskyella sp. DF17]|uniref:Mechanosensitive ion channel n=1 Tax=Winogradskyella pelagia TaxID=2819984 RepID=A0ABS3T0V8_9FLAO|nr:mechanosensitive ion channel family protein [Winogradskyella sp. DF17]MBO3116373.1 mechanosensitive ion channel [Winogradskyella sp. DF17]